MQARFFAGSQNLERIYKYMYKPENKNFISLYINKDVYKKIEHYAKVQERSKAYIINQLLIGAIDKIEGGTSWHD